MTNFLIAVESRVLAPTFRGEFCCGLFSCTIEVTKEVKDWICRVLHVLSSSVLSDAAGRKSTRKVFCEATELIVTMDYEFVGNSTSLPFSFLSCPLHMGISLPLGKRLIGVSWAMRWCQKPNFSSCRNANFVYL